MPPRPAVSPRHRQALDKLVALHEPDPKKVALIICGSLATGKAREDSDVDLYLVVTDDELARVRQTKDYFCGTWDPTAFFGLSVDGKIIGMDFLREAVTRASEPTRASLGGAYIEFSRNDEVAALIEQIGVYPESERANKLKAFYGQVKHHRYIAEEGVQLGNEYLVHRSISELVFFAARLVLAHNRVLFPCYKGLFAALARCGEMPSRFIERSYEVLQKMSFKPALDYYEEVVAFFQAYDYPDQERIGMILEQEWSWYTRGLAVGEW